MQKKNLVFNEQKYPVLFQICFGILCVILTQVFTRYIVKGIPLYNDMIFYILASYFGWTAIITSIIGDFLSIVFLSHFIETSPFLICTLSGCVLVRLFLQRKKEMRLFDLIFIILVMSLVVAIEGGIIYTIIYKKYDYQETAVSRYLTLQLIMQHIPLFASAILSRIPINLVDKTIAVVSSFFMALGIQTLRRKIIDS